jgi:hypothetical protein
MSDLAADKNHSWDIPDQLGLYGKNDRETKKLLLQKGVFPYEWTDSLERLINSTKVPDLKHFFSTLKNENITEQEHAHAVKVYKQLRCKNMLDYCEHYCMLDCGGLLECLWVFRDVIFANFGLEMCSFISLPQLSLQAFLKVTNTELELLTCADQYNFVEQAIRCVHT